MILRNDIALFVYFGGRGANERVSLLLWVAVRCQNKQKHKPKLAPGSKLKKNSKTWVIARYEAIHFKKRAMPYAVCLTLKKALFVLRSV